jgi:hypothetical protein
MGVSGDGGRSLRRQRIESLDVRSILTIGVCSDGARVVDNRLDRTKVEEADGIDSHGIICDVRRVAGHFRGSILKRLQ